MTQPPLPSGVRSDNHIDRSPLPGRAGAWAFRQRSWLPVPIALILVLVHRGEIKSSWPSLIGLTLVILGQLVRLWAVRHIGAISRTRATRLGPLVTDGPYAIVRNPLYAGNWLLWTGFTLWSGLIWMLPIVWAMFILQYGSIIRWEEERLQRHFGPEYAAYAVTVPRWRIRCSALPHAVASSASHPWNEVVFSERGTLLAIFAMSLMLALKRLG